MICDDPLSAENYNFRLEMEQFLFQDLTRLHKERHDEFNDTGLEEKSEINNETLFHLPIIQLLVGGNMDHFTKMTSLLSAHNWAAKKSIVCLCTPMSLKTTLAGFITAYFELKDQGKSINDIFDELSDYPFVRKSELLGNKITFSIATKKLDAHRKLLIPIKMLESTNREARISDDKRLIDALEQVMTEQLKCVIEDIKQKEKDMRTCRMSNKERRLVKRVSTSRIASYLLPAMKIWQMSNKLLVEKIIFEVKVT